MSSIFQTFFVFMILGVLWKWIPSVPSVTDLRKVIGALVLHLLLPLLTFVVLYRTPLDSTLYLIPVVALAVCISSLLIAAPIYYYLLPKLTSIAHTTAAVLTIAAAWGNVSYLGIPIITGIFGAEFIRVPILFDLLAMTPLVWTLGVYIASKSDSSQQKHTLKSSLRHLASLPPMYAVFAGLLCNALHVPVPEFLLQTGEKAGLAIAPLMLISVGSALRLPHYSKLLLMLPAASIKLVVAPCIAYLLLQYLPINQILARALIVESAMPTMVITMVIADRYSLDVSMLAQIIAFTTLLSFVWLSYLQTLV